VKPILQATVAKHFNNKPHSSFTGSSAKEATAARMYSHAPPSEGDKRRGEETQIGEREEQEDEGDEEAERDEQQAEGEEDREVDQNDDKDDNEHNEEPQTKLSDAITTKRTNRRC
jgi:hypothetical protein